VTGLEGNFMRMRGVCVNISRNPNGSYSAQIYQHRGKTERVMGRMIASKAQSIVKVKTIIDAMFRDRIRSVWITYDDVGQPAEMMQLHGAVAIECPPGEDGNERSLKL